MNDNLQATESLVHSVSFLVQFPAANDFSMSDNKEQQWRSSVVLRPIQLTEAPTDRVPDSLNFRRNIRERMEGGP